MKNTNTTVAGIVALICGAALLGIKFWRGEPLSDMEWATVAGLLGAGYGLLKAQDAPKQNKSAKFIKPQLVLLCLMPLFIVGCGQKLTTFSVNANEVTANNTAGNGLRIDGDGNLTGMYEGAPPAGAMQDAEGTWSVMPGAFGILTVDPASGKLYIMSPKDVVMTNVKITPQPAPGEPFFSADSVSANLSAVAAVYERQYASAVDGLKGMTQEAAKVQIKAWETAGDIVPEVAEMLLKSFVPTLPAAP